MRIVGGKWRGAPLVSPGGPVRPSREDLREALFAALTSDSPLRNARDPWPPLTDAKVLDLFAGTGSLGLEALSRGAACCDFVEDGPSALHALKANIAARRLAPLAKGTRPSGKHQAARLFKRDAIPFSAALSAHSYDYAFADPPYHSRKLDRILSIWQATPFAECLVIEHPSDLTLPGIKLVTIEDRTVTAFLASPQPSR